MKRRGKLISQRLILVIFAVVLIAVASFISFNLFPKSGVYTGQTKSASINENAVTLLSSSDEKATLVIPPSTTATAGNSKVSEVSVQMPDNVPDIGSGTSQVYRLGPSDARFSRKIKLKIKTADKIIFTHFLLFTSLIATLEK